MALMEFLDQNKIDTTGTLFIALSGTSGTELFLFDNNKNTTWGSVGFSADTNTVISFEFATPTVISHMLLLNHNIQTATIFFDSTTASSLGTISGNSATSTYLSFSSTTVSSIEIQLEATIAGSEEYSIGELIWSNRQLVFERNPSTKDFSPRTVRTQVQHKMPDGGITIFNIQNKFSSRLKWKFITTAFKDNLQTLYDAANPLLFVPFPTTGTDWDGIAHETVWTNAFDFKHSDNAKTQGFEGQIDLKETPSG